MYDVCMYTEIRFKKNPIKQKWWRSKYLHIPSGKQVFTPTIVHSQYTQSAIYWKRNVEQSKSIYYWKKKVCSLLTIILIALFTRPFDNKPFNIRHTYLYMFCGVVA